MCSYTGTASTHIQTRPGLPDSIVIHAMNRQERGREKGSRSNMLIKSYLTTTAKAESEKKEPTIAATSKRSNEPIRIYLLRNVLTSELSTVHLHSIVYALNRM